MIYGKFVEEKALFPVVFRLPGQPDFTIALTNRL